MRNATVLGEQTVSEWGHIRLVIGAVTILVALTACGQSEGGSHRGRGVEKTAWTVHVRKVYAALAKKDISGAEWAWHYAYVAGLRSGSWKSMIEIGDAARCIDEAAKFRKGTADRARESYQIALLRARFQDSIEGLRRTARAFAALGDREAVDQCLQIAKSLGSGLKVSRLDVPSVVHQ